MFSIIIPVYNEAENVSSLLEEILDSLSSYNDYEIIVVNDCSTDKTVDIVTNKKNDKIKLINNTLNFGQSYSIKTGINSSKYNIIVTIDGDGQNDPGDIPNLLDMFMSQQNVKLVGGIRFKRQDSLIKVISSKIANNIRIFLLNDDCVDTGCSLKVFDKNIFLQFPYFDGIHRFLPALFKGFGHKTTFLKVNHRKRLYGYSKYGTMNRLFKGIRDIIRIKKILKIKNNA